MTHKANKAHKATLLVLMAVMTTTLAQTPPAPYVLTSYDLRHLDSRPGEIIVAPNYLTIIEFDDQVEQVATGRSDLIQVEVEENRILVRPTRGTGRTDLIVNVEGRTALFVVRVDSDSQNPRRYVITIPPPPTPVTRTVTPSPSRPVTPQVPPTASPDRPAQAEAPLPPTEPPFSFYFNVLSAPTGELVIQYALNNTGENAIANDATRLRLVEGGRTVPYLLNRVSTGGTVNRIFPGRAEYGTILIQNPPPTTITLEWPIVELGPAFDYLISREINRGVSLEAPAR